MSLATITTTGRSAYQKSLMARPLHLAWGTGDPAWDTDPALKPSLVQATRLVAEAGRRVITKKAFVVPDPDGDIILPSGLSPEGQVQESRYRVVNFPTPSLYVHAAFDFGDAANLTIREKGIFCDTEVDPALPPGQRYFTPGQLVSSGELVVAEIVTPFQRSPSVRQFEEFVITL